MADILFVSAEGHNTNEGAVYVFQNISGTWTEVQKLTVSDGQPNDPFGFSLAASDDYLIVGAYGQDTDASGANSLTNAGAAYIFKNISGTWTQMQKITASDRTASDEFGHSVVIYGDYVAVGGRNRDYATIYVYKNVSDNWTDEIKITPSTTNVQSFTSSLNMTSNTIVEAAEVSGPGTLYVFKNESGNWTESQTFTASGGYIGDFGFGLTLSDNYLLGAAPGGSIAYMFSNQSGTWCQDQILQPSDVTIDDYFGTSMGLHEKSTTKDGVSMPSMAFIGAPQQNNSSGGTTLQSAGAVYVYELSGVGIKNVSNFDFKLHPNPARDILRLDFPSDKIKRLEVYDLLGKKVSKFQEVGKSLSINVSQWNNGVYLIKVHTSEGTFTRKFVKK